MSCHYVEYKENIELQTADRENEEYTDSGEIQCFIP